MKHVLWLLLFASAPLHAENWNLRTSPLGLLARIANLRLDYRLSDHWVIGPELAGLDQRIRGVDMRAGGVGIATMYYFNRTFEDSPFLEIGLSGSHIRAEAKNDAGELFWSEFNNRSLRVLGGYHWFWNSVNLSLGGGLGTNSAGEVQIKDSNGNEVDHVRLRPITVALDFTVGVTF